MSSTGAGRFAGPDYLGLRAAIRMRVARVRRGEGDFATVRDALLDLPNHLTFTLSERAVLLEVIEDYRKEDRR